MTNPRTEALDRMTDWAEPVEIVKEPTGRASKREPRPPRNPDEKRR